MNHCMAHYDSTMTPIGIGYVILVTIILYMSIVYISLIDKCELMTCILYEEIIKVYR